MAITIVQTATNFNGTPSTGLAVVISTATAGNRIIAVLSAATANANVSEVTGLFTEDAARNVIGAGSSCSIWSKESDGTEGVVQFSFGVSCINEAIVFEVSGLADGPVYIDGTFGQAPGTNTTTTSGPIAAIRAKNEFIVLGLEATNTLGAFVSFTNSYVSDNPVSSNNRLIAGHLIQTVANATQQTVVTWTTSRPFANVMVAYFGNEINFYPSAFLFRNQRPSRRVINARRSQRVIRRTLGGTPQVHDLTIPRQRRRLPKRRPRRDFARTPGQAAPQPYGLIRQHSPARTRLRRSLLYTQPPSQILVAPAYPYELLHTRRTRTTRLRRGRIFVYPLPSGGPSPPDPRVIEPIRGFLVTDGRTTGILVTDGHTTGLLLTDGHTYTVLLT